MTVREATLADLDAMHRIELACFPAEPWSRASLAEELHRPGIVALVAEDDDGVTGFALGLMVIDTMDVLQIAVDPARQRRGTGRALVQALHAAAPFAAQAFLEVRVDNAPAIAMYLACGYVEIHVRRRYYSDGCDARILRCGLTPAR